MSVEIGNAYVAARNALKYKPMSSIIQDRTCLSDDCGEGETNEATPPRPAPVTTVALL